MPKFFFVLLASIVSVTLLSQDKIDRKHFVELLQQGKYQDVFDECMSLRNGVYGKSALLDYFIAKSLCLDSFKQKSQEWLKYILAHYPLKNETRNFITSDITNCSSGNASTSLGPMLTIPLPQASVSGVTKLGVILNCSDKSQLINWENLYSEDDLESRLFSSEAKDTAVRTLKKLLGKGYSVNFLKRFIIVSPVSNNITQGQVKKITDLLQRAFDFYTSFYQLRQPDKLITVYLMPDQKSLHEVAFKVHGIDVGNATLGYSLLSDLSLLGISTPDHVGTLYHELFHLLVRTDVGDIPAWLDEGLASLYSVYEWDGDTLKGSDKTWRIGQLDERSVRSSGMYLPQLSQLISYTWDDFDGGANINLCRASINYALANFFMIYLQEEGLLRTLVTAFKTGVPPIKDDNKPVITNVGIVERVCNAPIEKIQSDFNQWFSTKYHFNPYGWANDGRGVEYDFIEIEEIQEKTSDILDNSAFQKKVSKRYIDSARKQLATLRENFSTLKSQCANQNSTTVQECGNKANALKERLFHLYLDLYNKRPPN